MFTTLLTVFPATTVTSTEQYAVGAKNVKASPPAILVHVGAASVGAKGRKYTESGYTSLIAHLHL